jgi:hypothetical protein
MNAATECDCTEDYGPCEDHGTLAVYREGSSIRTGDELLLVFCMDALDLIATVTGEDRMTPWAGEVLADANENLEASRGMGVAWLSIDPEGDAIRDDLQTLANQLESDLGTLDASHWTYWEDGFRVVRIHADCPLLDM